MNNNSFRIQTSNDSSKPEDGNRYTKPSFPRHHQISPTIFAFVSNHHTTSDNQSHPNREIIDISDDDEKEDDKNTCKNGTSIDDSSDEEEIEVIQLSDDDDEMNDETINESSANDANGTVPRNPVVITLGLTCPECFTLMDSRPELVQHLLVAHDKSPFKCIVRGCEKQFVKRFRLTQHYADHEANHTKWICSAVDCKYETSIRSYFISHMRRYHEIGLFQCSLCLAEYSKKSLVYNHYNKMHKH